MCIRDRHIVLQRLGQPGDEGHAHGQRQPAQHAAHQFALRPPAGVQGVVVNDAAENERVHQVKHLAGTGQQQGEEYPLTQRAKVAP